MSAIGTAVHPGDRVIISCVTACGKCDYCRKGMYSHCRNILPTGSECGVLNGQVEPGDTVAIVGAGPIGLAVLLTIRRLPS